MSRWKKQQLWVLELKWRDFYPYAEPFLIVPCPYHPGILKSWLQGLGPHPFYLLMFFRCHCCSCFMEESRK